jgi:hypothetical protein
LGKKRHWQPVKTRYKTASTITLGTAGRRSVFGSTLSIIANGGGVGERGDGLGGLGGSASGGDISTGGGKGQSMNPDYDGYRQVGGYSVLGASYGGGGEGAQAIGGSGASIFAGSGGGGGGYSKKIVPTSSLGSTENYIAGYRGTGEVGGGSGANTGGDGGAGVIVLTEYYA